MCQYQELTVFAPVISAVVAAIALGVAWKNLRGLQRSQTLQAQMNLISLENEMRKNHIQYKAAVEEYDAAVKEYIDATSTQDKRSNSGNRNNISNLENKKTNAFELYITSADRLAALINADYLHSQFPGRDWKKEYSEIFQKVKACHRGDYAIIPGKKYMVRNIDETLKKWTTNQLK
ncbi:MAG: hypothetical protein LBR86_08620 [Tannerella sp.]|jgi:hypothetical protein|nr:hypothetical protein [Tannerella sp.]